MSDREKLAADIRQKFQGWQNLVKTAEAREKDALKKLAGSQAENRILRETLDLVSKGVIDPADAMEKVEEFSQDPEQLEVVKQAYMLGFDTVPSIGSLTESDVPDAADKSPEGILHRALSDLEPTLRKNSI